METLRGRRLRADVDGVINEAVDSVETPFNEAKKEVFRCLNAFFITPLIVDVVDGNVSCRWFFSATAM